MALNKVASLVAVGFVILSTTSGASATAYQQLPDHTGGFLSDQEIFAVADDFQLIEAASIQSITWWGGYSSGSADLLPSADSFIIRLFADDGGKPGTLLQDSPVGDNAARTSTGNFVNPPDFSFFPPFEGRPEFEYSFNFPVAFSVSADTHYWFSIVNLNPANPWVWENSDSLLNSGVQRSFNGGPWDPFIGANTAFSLGLVSLVPEPEIYIMLLAGLGLLGFMTRRKNKTLSLNTGIN